MAAMHEYHAQIAWQRHPREPFTDQRYSRLHLLRFDGGIEVPASSAPSSVPLPYSHAEAVDPEEMFVASLSSCHMLWFLSLAAKDGWRVDRYDDDAVGIMSKNAEGKVAMTRVTLRPGVAFSGDKTPSAAELEALHHLAHEECFIANSVKCEVRVEPQP
jgi:organic hydroperoxide reductase OsmC/OhrA